MNFQKPNQQTQVTKMAKESIKPFAILAFSSVVAIQASVATANPFNFNSARKGVSQITSGSEKVLSVSIPEQGQVIAWGWDCPLYTEEGFCWS